MSFTAIFSNLKHEELKRYGYKHQERLKELLEIYNEDCTEEKDKIFFEKISEYDYVFAIFYGEWSNGDIRIYYNIREKDLNINFVFVRNFEKRDIKIVNARKVITRSYEKEHSEENK